MGEAASLRQRSQGRVLVAVERRGGATRRVRVAEAGPSRIRFPNGPGPALEGVLLNTAGGIACGDRYEVAAELGPGADLVLTTIAAEKVYRSDGPVAEVAVRLDLAPGAALAWLPQETILFDTGRLARRFEADLAPDARLLMFEAAIFGRRARGETVREGFFEDRWRIRRGGRLVFADTLRLEGAIAERLARPTMAAGHPALATVLYVAADAESRLEEARSLLPGPPCLSGASAWNGCLAVRLLAPDVNALRTGAAQFLTGFRGTPLPRVWQA